MSTNDWKKRRDEALAKTPDGTGEHAWFKFKDDNFDCCARCGIIRRKDDKNKPCPGKVKITLRNQG